MAKLVRTVTAVSVLLLLSGGLTACSSSGSDPGSIGNDVKQSEVKKKKPKKVNPNIEKYTDKDKFDKVKVQEEITTCLNKLTRDVLKPTSNIVSDCFYSYGKHLPSLVGLRDVHELTVSDLKMIDKSTHLISFNVKIEDDVVAQVQAYAGTETNQFKVVDTEITQRGNDIMNKGLESDARAFLEGGH